MKIHVNRHVCELSGLNALEFLELIPRAKSPERAYFLWYLIFYKFASEITQWQRTTAPLRRNPFDGARSFSRHNRGAPKPVLDELLAS